MLRNLLLCGLLAGLCGGLLATGFARVVGETQINQAIAFEDSQYKAQGLPPEKPIVSRSLQSSLGLLTAAVVYGLALAASSPSPSRLPTGASAEPARPAPAS